MAFKYSQWIAQKRDRLRQKLRRRYCELRCNSQPDPLTDVAGTVVTIFYDVEGNYAKAGMHGPCLDSLEKILKIEQANGINTTYNTVAKLAQEAPDLIRSIHAAGNEIASHSFDHKVLSTMPRELKFDNIRRARDAFAELDIPIQGHRSPQSKWDFDVVRCLASEGYSWNAENGNEAHPFLISAKPGKRLWRFPVRDDDWWYEGSGYSPARMLTRLKGVVNDARQARRYTAIGFHPWIENPPERLAAYSDFIQWLASLDDVTVLTFAQTVQLMEEKLQ